MPKVTVRKYSTIDEWNSAFFPTFVSQMRLANVEGNPASLAEILAEEALKHATSKLAVIKKGNKLVANLHK